MQKSASWRLSVLDHERGSKQRVIGQDRSGRRRFRAGAAVISGPGEPGRRQRNGNIGHLHRGLKAVTASSPDSRRGRLALVAAISMSSIGRGRRGINVIGRPRPTARRTAELVGASGADWRLAVTCKSSDARTSHPASGHRRPSRRTWAGRDFWGRGAPCSGSAYGRQRPARRVAALPAG